MTSKGKTYQIEDETDTVRVTVRAKRSVLHSLRVHDIKAYADMKEMSLGSQIPIEVSIPGVNIQKHTQILGIFRLQSKMKRRIRTRLHRRQQEVYGTDMCSERSRRIRKKYV